MEYAQIKCVPFMGQCCPFQIFFFADKTKCKLKPPKNFMALGHEWNTHRLNVFRSWVSAAQFFFFFKLFMALGHEWNTHRLNVFRSWVSAAQFFFFFFKLFMALGHEWNTHRLNVFHSWVSAAQFFFF